MTIELTPEITETLKKKHEHLQAFRLDRGGQEFVVRPPTAAEFERALDKAADGGRRKVEATTELGEACLVFPEASELQKHLAAKPGLAFTAGNFAFELAGLSDGYGVKKL